MIVVACFKLIDWYYGCLWGFLFLVFEDGSIGNEEGMIFKLKSLAIFNLNFIKIEMKKGYGAKGPAKKKVERPGLTED